MVKRGVIHFNSLKRFHKELGLFLGENTFTKYGEDDRNSLKLLTKCLQHCRICDFWGESPNLVTNLSPLTLGLIYADFTTKQCVLAHEYCWRPLIEGSPAFCSTLVCLCSNVQLNLSTA